FLAQVANISTSLPLVAQDSSNLHLVMSWLRTYRHPPWRETEKNPIRRTSSLVDRVFYLVYWYYDCDEIWNLAFHYLQEGARTFCLVVLILLLLFRSFET